MTVLTQLADDFAPIKRVTRRPRQSDPWFDADCRLAERLTRRLEPAAAAGQCRIVRVPGGHTLHWELKFFSLQILVAQKVGFNFQVDDRLSPLSNFQNPHICVGRTQFKNAQKFAVRETKSLLDPLF